MSFFKKKNLQKQNPQIEEIPDIKNMREIVIKTDGSNIHLEKAEVSGSLELGAVLTSILEALNSGRLRINAKIMTNKNTKIDNQKVEKPKEANQ